MTTQTEMREMVTYRDVERAVSALLPDNRYPAVAQWRDRWASDTMHAIGYVVADLMIRADVRVWECDGYTVAAHDLRQADNERGFERTCWVQVRAEDGSRRQYGEFGYVGPREHYGGAVDPEMLRDWMQTEYVATIAPDAATWCGACDGPLWSFTVGGDAGITECDHCGAPVKVCEFDCVEFGGDVCIHHGAPTVPITVYEAHDCDFDAAMSALANDPHTRAVVQAASRPDGIWHFPNGKLAD